MLESYRREIDKIDAELASLLERRLEAARGIGGYKREHGLPVANAKREEQVLARVVSHVKNPQNIPVITRMWRHIMETSRDLQQDTRDWRSDTRSRHIHKLIENARQSTANPLVAFQGINGSNSHEATAAYFGKNVRTLCTPSFEKVCRAVEDGTVDYGVLPLENNTTGPIARVRELIDSYGLYITGEQNLRIEHCLLAVKGADPGGLSEVVSHEQALMQCSKFLERHEDIRSTAGANTAVCARDIAQAGCAAKAAIASPFAAKLYGLDIINDKISDNSNNCTRFVVVSKFPELPEGRDKVSVLFTVHHRSGALHRVLSIFADHRLNMTKLESIPIGGADFEYLFLADFIGDLAREGTQKALAAIHDECVRVRVLGNYKSKRRNIVLTGMPGCGKNAIGKALAARLGMAYADIDEMVENAAGRSISKIFTEDGEQAFRDMESRTAEQAAAMGGIVISTGGGTMLRTENVRVLRRTGLVFFINRPVNDILAGVDLSNRPLLAKEPQKIHRLYEERLPVYRATADHEVINDCELEYTVNALDDLLDLLKSGGHSNGGT